MMMMVEKRGKALRNLSSSNAAFTEVVSPGHARVAIRVQQSMKRGIPYFVYCYACTGRDFQLCLDWIYHCTFSVACCSSASLH